MSKPMTAAEQVAAFKAYGLKVVERAGWKTHNRDGHGDFAPVGLVMHHTGSDTSAASMERYLYDGDAGRALPGPLCQWSIRTDGTIVMIGNGRANHAGRGSSATLNKVRTEDYSGDIKPGPDNSDGNVFFYGIETQYAGVKAPVKAQYDAMVKAAAAVCDHHGWSAKSVIGHKEWTSRKNDPGKVDMSDFRADVAKAIAAHNAPPPPKPNPVVVDLSNVQKAAKTDPDAKDGTFTAKADVLPVEKALVAEGLLDSSLADGHFGTATIAAYAKWQLSAAGGSAEPKYADGVPGIESLTRLGKRHGWTVKA